jgi:hypothetical protein
VAALVELEALAVLALLEALAALVVLEESGALVVLVASGALVVLVVLEESAALVRPRCLLAGAPVTVPAATGHTIRSIVAVPHIATGRPRTGLGAVRAEILWPNARPVPSSELAGRVAMWPAAVERAADSQVAPAVEA